MKRNKKEILAEAITLLEIKQASELKLLKEQFQETYESLKPINLIKNTFKEVEDSPEIRKNILNAAVGLATGFLSKKVLTSDAQTPMKKVIGTLLQFALAKVVSSNSENIISTGGSFLQRLLNNKGDAKKEFSSN